jgi:uncharacterized repeat protein (TIGR02543 family)
VWEYSTNGTAWTAINNSDSAEYTHSVSLTETTMYRRKFSNACGEVYSDTITVTVNSELNGGKIGANQEICYNTRPARFTSEEAASGGRGANAYVWEYSTNGTAWTAINNSDSVAYTHSVSLTETTMYRRKFSNDCGEVYSDTITVTVNSELNGGKIGSDQEICYNTQPARFTSAEAASGGRGANVYEWEYSTNGTAWTAINNSDSAEYTHSVSLTETTKYRRKFGNACGAVYSDTITVTVKTCACTVTFNGNGGGPPPADTSVEYGGKVAAPAAIMKIGHDFVSWCRDAELTTPWDFDADIVTQSITLYAEWTPSYYTVAFNGNGGIPELSGTVVEHGGTVSAPVSNPTKEGYIFNGWYSDSAGKHLWDFGFRILEDRTLYAGWTPLSDIKSLALLDENDNELVSLGYENISDATYYELPCNLTNDSLTIAATLFDSATVRFEWESLSISVLPNTPYSWGVDVSKPGSKTFTIVFSSGKRYTLVVSKRYGLFDLITEHMGNIRVVLNNPELNGGLKFDFCRWHYKKAGDKWDVVQSGSKLYYSAGPSITDKFSPEDSMRVELRTVDGSALTTCPDADIAGKNSANGGSSSLKSDVDIDDYAYPNPVRGGSKIYIKESLFIASDGEERYSTCRLFTSQGRLVLSGSASALIEGLVMPETSGSYFLILDGKAGRRAIQIAVIN